MNAAEILRLQDLLPTELGSDEIREAFAEDVLRSSVFSAKMASVPYLEDVREVCAAVLEGRMSDSEARSRLGEALERMGHSPLDEGGLENPASERRLNLIIETQTRMAASAARLMAETPDTLDAYPGWALRRFDTPAAPREDWPARWNAAGESVGWEGAKRGVWYGSGSTVAFAALKSSPIWAALGDGAGGFDDAIGNPFPPFAFGSYMDWEDLDRETCEKIGLLEAGEEAPAPGGAALSPDDEELLEAARKAGWPGLFDDILGGAAE